MSRTTDPQPGENRYRLLSGSSLYRDLSFAEAGDIHPGQESVIERDDGGYCVSVGIILSKRAAELMRELDKAATISDADIAATQDLVMAGYHGERLKRLLALADRAGLEALEIAAAAYEQAMDKARLDLQVLLRKSGASLEASR